MDFKNLFILVIWTKVALALERLRIIIGQCLLEGGLCVVTHLSWKTSYVNTPTIVASKVKSSKENNDVFKYSFYFDFLECIEKTKV